jgi:hypothetical protein
VTLRYLPEHVREVLVHEYMHDAQVFLDSLLAAHAACELFFQHRRAGGRAA